MNVTERFPVFFGPQNRPIFGWLHLHRGAHLRRDIGLVLCNPFGFDAICSHRTLRHLADRAAQLGIPSIRFDYDGTGDSAGSEFDPDRVAAWQASIHAAADFLKTATGVPQLCLLGIRLGALLAANVATQRSDVSGLIGVSPVVRPKSYLRELRALQAALFKEEQEEQSLFECAGYTMTGETVAALEKLEFIASNRAPAKNVLILDRQDLPAAKGVSESLQQYDCNITYLLTPDHEYLVRSPSPLELPEHIIGTCSSWLEKSFPHLTSAPAAELHMSRELPANATMAVKPAAVIREHAEFNGATPDFFAITSRAAHTPDTQAPKKGILLLNSGAVHHIGPSRQYVTLARDWAAQGHVVMRMDLRGIGDCPAGRDEPENIIYPAHAYDSVRAAVAHLKGSHGVTEVTAIGLCSGAYHSFLAAKSGADLTSIIMMNPLTFYWEDGMPLDEGELSPGAAVAALEAARYQRSFLKIRTWLKLLTLQVDFKSFIATMSRQLATQYAVIQRDLQRLLRRPLANDLPADLRQIAAREIHPVMIFGGSDLGLPRMRMLGGSALQRMLKSKLVELHVIDGADHTFMRLKHRKQLVAILTELVADRPPGVAPDRDVSV